MIINTCAVTAESARKSRQAIRRIEGENPGAVVAVCGCYAQISPDDVAALTWDSINILLQAIQKNGKIDPDLKKERKIIRDNMASMEKFDGITGSMKFDENRDPIKCAVIVRVTETGAFAFVESVCPK